MKKFEILSHPADLKIRGFGQNLSELFANIAYGMFFGVTEKLGQKKGCLDFKVSGAEDYESLLINFLNIVWIFSFEKNSAMKDINFQKFDLSGIVGSGKLINVLSWKSEIKSATFYNLKIKKTQGGFVATVVFDI